MLKVIYIRFFNNKTKNIIDRGFLTIEAALEFKEAIEVDWDCEDISLYTESLEEGRMPNNWLNLTKVNGRHIYI